MRKMNSAMLIHRERPLLLDDIPLFSPLPEEDLSLLKEQTIIRKYRDKQPIINEGDESTSLYVILSGKVKIYSTEETGKIVTLAFHRRGDFFGEIALLDGKPRSASAITAEQSLITVVPRSIFLGLLKKHPEIALKITGTITHRIRQLTDGYKTMALKNVYGRIKFQLERESQDPNRPEVVTECLIHQEIANLVGASREMVTRILSELRSGGYITIHTDKRIQINKTLPRDW